MALITNARSTPGILKPLAGLITVIAIWSLSPVALVHSSGLLPGEIIASVAVVIGVITLCAFFLLTDRTVLAEARDLLRLRLAPASHKTYIYLLLLSSLGFVAYPWFYVQAISGAADATTLGTASISNAVVVNLINYLWPCCAVVFASALFGAPFSSKQASGVVMALLGALLAVSSATGARIWLLSWFYGDATHASFPQPSWFFVFAGLGALSWGFYSALLPHVQFFDAFGKEIRSSVLYVTLLLLSLPLHALYAITQWKVLLAFPYSYTTTRFSFFLLYSIGSLAVAHCLFAYTLRSKQLTLASTMAATYFVFAVGTLLLFAFTRDGISSPIVAGFSLIITGVFLARDTALISPIPGFLIFLVISYSLSDFFVSAPHRGAEQDALYATFLEILAALFAILAAFTLAKAGTRYIEWRRTFDSLIDACASIAHASVATDTDRTLLRNLMTSIQSTYTQRYTNSDRVTSHSREAFMIVDHELRRIDTFFATPTTGSTSDIRALTRTIRTRLRDWLSTSMHAVTSYEWLVLVALVLIMVVVGYRITITEPIFLLARAGFDAGLIVILFAVADLDNSRPGHALECLRHSYHRLPSEYQEILPSTAQQLATSSTSETVLVASVVVFQLLSR